MAAAGQRVLANFTARRSGSLVTTLYIRLIVFFVVSQYPGYYSGSNDIPSVVQYTTVMTTTQAF
jgi:hypothetical protein